MKNRKVVKTVSSFIKNQDSFGSRVSLMYKGDTEYKSFFGGLLSLIGKILLLIYITSEVLKVLDIV